MIDFLKESSFAVNDVLKTAIDLLKKHYISIAGLGLLMFITWNLSEILAGFMGEINWGINVLMFIFFILFYFGLQLTLFKYILRLLDDKEAGNVTIRNSVPTRKQIAFFLIGTLYFIACIILVYALIAVLFFPLIYTGLNMNMIIQVAASLGMLAIIITWIRISFFPFFIIDQNAHPFKSIRFSLAITRGNFTKIFLLLVFFAIFHALSFYFNYQGYSFLSTIISIVNSFLIVPLSGVAIAVAYRQMMAEYRGDEDPDIIHNII
ncbi:hypothetical protein GS399_20100 [Pedobacter sp. HMF7647]|uniref:Beta-carotene 15,15'-monooxygenase n=1 Tax=Hufsiella arboris TaxID=2695275 RepID=A0A7K1YF99_9SPHI|nr:hypothetical protein [Hufsiella arboris]MXV53275.1 hypothetical protein [Hufsiella arboris]